MSISIYKIKKNEVFPSNDTELDSSHIYIIVDQLVKRPRIWVWSGKEASLKERYIAGVSATKIKSQERLYGASIEVVEQGNEPENFPQLDSIQVSQASKDEIQKPISFATLEQESTIGYDHPEISGESGSIAVEGEEDLELAADSAEVEEVEALPVVVEKPVEKPSKKVGPRKRAKPSKSDSLFKEKMHTFLKDFARSLEDLKNKLDAFIVDLEE